MNDYNIKRDIEQFCGKIDEVINKSIVIMEILVVDNGITNILGTFTSDEIVSQIKILNNSVTLDINYDDPRNEEYIGLVELMKLYEIIKNDKNIKVINTIFLVENNDSSEEQIMFIDPIFVEKCSNTAGRPINGFRLAYNFDNVIHQKIEDPYL